MSHAFSLVELLVVITIVAILSAVSIAAYNTYSLRVKVAKVVPVISSLAHQALITYEKTGVLPNSIEYNAIIIPQNVGMRLVSTDDIQQIDYQNNNGFGSPVFTAWVLVSAQLLNLEGIPGYVSPPAVNTFPFGSKAFIRYLIGLDSEGIYKTYCGIYWPAGNPNNIGEIPPEYLPSGCNCTDLGGLIAGTTSTCQN